MNKQTILCITDLHGDFSFVKPLLDEVKPDLLISCGDWGEPGEVSVDDFDNITQNVHVLSVYGNHDDLGLLADLRNSDGSPVLLQDGETVDYCGIRIAGISGIWAKSHARPWYRTDGDVVKAAEKAAEKSVDILVTHGCAVGLNDLLPGNRRGGNRCFLDAFKICRPWVYMCGHLHSQQIKLVTGDRYVLNIGQTSRGDYAVVERCENTWMVSVKKLKMCV